MDRGGPRRPLSAGVRRRRFFLTVADHALLITGAAMFAVPIVFIALTALMTDRQALTKDLWPDPFVWSNFKAAWTKFPMYRYTWNTLQIAVLTTIGTVVSCVPVAYALSRLRWRYRQAAFVLILSTFMLPGQVTAIPLYIIFVRLDWINTFRPLIVPSFFGDAFSIFLLRQFFMSIPQEYVDAARVDGGNEFQIMLRVVVPLAKTAIMAIALFNFMYAWNDFFTPLLYLQDTDMYTLALGLQSFRTLHHVDWNLTLAASLLVTLPVMVIFFFAQKVFMEGVTLTGVKG